MILFKKIIEKPLKDTKGFSIMELMVVVAIIGVLASIAIYSYMPMRAKALDSAARSDARNLVSSVVDAIMNKADVDFTKAFTGGAVGAVDTAGNPRKPIFVLSSGVAAFIQGNSVWGADSNNTFITAYVYHTGGTDDPFSISGSGKKEFVCIVDASAGVSSGPK